MKTTLNGQPRVVVTGLGALTPLGTLDAFWQNLKEGNSGIRRITHFDPHALTLCVLDVAMSGNDRFDQARRARGGTHRVEGQVTEGIGRVQVVNLGHTADALDGLLQAPG